MGEKLIDDLARALAKPMPRRHAVRTIGVAVRGAAGRGVARPDVNAKCV